MCSHLDHQRLHHHHRNRATLDLQLLLLCLQIQFVDDDGWFEFVVVVPRKIVVGAIEEVVAGAAHANSSPACE